MVMTCSLMIYAALEHRIRQGLVEQNRSVADMKKKKPTQQPTARWIFCALVASMHIPADHEHQFRFNVNTISDQCERSFRFNLNTSPLLSGNSVQHPGITVHIHRNHP